MGNPASLFRLLSDQELLDVMTEYRKFLRKHLADPSIAGRQRTTAGVGGVSTSWTYSWDTADIVEALYKAIRNRPSLANRVELPDRYNRAGLGVRPCPPQSDNKVVW